MKLLSQYSDEELMISYKDGKNDAFEELYRRYHSNIYTYLKKRVRNAEQLNEIFQNTFLKLHKSRSKYNSKYKFVQWIYTITRSEIIDHFRKSKNMQQTEFNEEYHSDLSVPAIIENEKLSFDHHPNLSDNEKKALDLRYYSEQDFGEIATVLNITESNTRKIISRALKKLKLNFQ